MNRRISLVMLLLLACMLTGSYAAEKSDARLSKKITCYSGYVRLSDAVAEISKLSGIKIAAGISRNDWQVRDMPVVMCINDIEVGKLLNMMTDAYFLALKKTDVDGEVLYRFYRPKIYQDILSKANDKEESYKYQRELYKWKLYDWMGSLSDEDVEKLYQQINQKNPNCLSFYGPDSQRLGYDEVVSYSKLIKSLGEEGMAKLMNGEDVTLSVGQGGDVGKMVQDYILQKKEIVDALVAEISKSVLMDKHGNPLPSYTEIIPEPETPDLEQAQIKFTLDSTNGISLKSSVSAGPFYAEGFLGDLTSFTLALEQSSTPKDLDPQSTSKSSEKPVFPKYSKQPMYEMKYLTDASNNLLKPETKYEFKKPAKETVTLADVLTEVSKTTGYSILADDYLDHRDIKPGTYKDVFTGKKSLVNVMWSSDIKYRFKWYINEENKLIDLKPVSWPDNYNNLVPKTSFADWLDKANSSGLELYDFLAMWRLTDGQELDWIQDVKDLRRFIVDKSMAHESLLNILAAMSVDELNTAYGSGIYLANIANLNTEQLKKLFNTLPAESRPAGDISQLYMKLVEHKILDFNVEKRTYTIVINGGKEPLEFILDLAFPIYSFDREKEVIKEATAEGMKIK
ncbi:MAG: hypothetical protein ABFD46_05390 [Armatimonadota bacterium]